MQNDAKSREVHKISLDIVDGILKVWLTTYTYKQLNVRGHIYMFTCIYIDVQNANMYVHKW